MPVDLIENDVISTLVYCVAVKRYFFLLSLLLLLLLLLWAETGLINRHLKLGTLNTLEFYELTVNDLVSIKGNYF